MNTLPINVRVVRPVRVRVHGQDNISAHNAGEIIPLSGEELQVVLGTGHVEIYQQEEQPKEKQEKGKQNVPNKK